MMGTFCSEPNLKEIAMRFSSVYPLFGAALLACSLPGLAETATVKITAPAEGARLAAMDQNQVVYEVVPGSMGDHTHLYVDNKEVAVLRQLKGSHTLAALTPGQHAICIKVVNKGHTPIGVEQCVKVNVN